MNFQKDQVCKIAYHYLFSSECDNVEIYTQQPLASSGWVPNKVASDSMFEYGPRVFTPLVGGCSDILSCLFVFDIHLTSCCLFLLPNQSAHSDL